MECLVFLAIETVTAGDLLQETGGPTFSFPLSSGMAAVLSETLTSGPLAINNHRMPVSDLSSYLGTEMGNTVPEEISFFSSFSLQNEQSRELFVGMPLAGTPAPVKRKKSTKLIGKLTHEAMPQEVSKLNLGKKISIPRDVMLEELSLLTNKGSKMFKLRQLRVEKFIYENNPDAFTDNSVERQDHFQKFIPPGGHYGEDAHGYAHGRMVGGMPAGQHGSSGSSTQQHHAVPPRPGSRGGARDDGKSGGKKVTIFKTYISPWERAMGISPEDKSQFSTDLLSYSPKADFPHYKSFNRTAMPYGGYEKAAKRMTFKVPQFDICPLLPESLMIYNQNFSKRPSFNRTPIPWMPSGDFSEYQTAVNVPVCGETEEL
ncbi:hypothetical protein DUI87_11758 [Hirundo rustica rustica]|uniref:Myozenin-1 n=1 Tax=Hirundo rustica rustica TaxID=333673 RepID=A0A3M0KES1_HIRRU|nr:hypothetical protein DUI87_11758 [Hirundo rustica rustica]